MKRIILIVLVIYTVLMTFTGCITNTNDDYIPYRRPDTTWVSEDGTIVFTVSESGSGTGTMTVEDETIEFYFSAYFDHGIYIFPISVTTEEIPEPTLPNLLIRDLEFEYWGNSSTGKDIYIVYVWETTYFEKGQEIVFHRVDDNS